jgi:hypothetical protein
MGYGFNRKTFFNELVKSSHWTFNFNYIVQYLLKKVYKFDNYCRTYSLRIRTTL